jgi:serine/threonine protein phosphatase PrpC
MALLAPQWQQLTHQGIYVTGIQGILQNHPFGQENGFVFGLDHARPELGLSCCTMKNVNKSPENQDVTLVYISPDRRTKVGAVFDGHAPYGLFAAAIAATTLRILLDANSTNFSQHDHISQLLPTFYNQMHQNINDGLCQLFGGTMNAEGFILHGQTPILGGTTCSIVISHVDSHGHPSTIYSYVGDSDIYKLTATGIALVSIEKHVSSNEAEMIPVANRGAEGKVVRPEFGGIGIAMTRSLGDAFMGPFQRHDPTIIVEHRLDTVLIGSDGLWDLLLPKFNTVLPGLSYRFMLALSQCQTSYADEILTRIKPLTLEVLQHSPSYDDVSLVVMTDGNGLEVPFSSLCAAQGQLLQARLSYYNVVGDSLASFTGKRMKYGTRKRSKKMGKKSAKRFIKSAKRIYK